MALGSICHYSLSEQEQWCVLLDCCTLHPELFFTAGVSGMVHARSLDVKDVIFDEVPGHQLKSVLVPKSILH